MKKIYVFGLGLLIASIFALVVKYFSNPYPCSISCCGCSSYMELLSDAWVEIVGIMGMLFGFCIMLYSIFKSGV